MQILPLLGQRLKDDDVIEELEAFEMEVVYDFDRLHEGQPDKYWASSKACGIQLGFDADQVLSIGFFHMAPADGFSGFIAEGFDIPVYAALSEVAAVAKTQGLDTSSGETEFLGVARKWVRLSFATHSVHYEFRDGTLALITVSRLTTGCS